MVFDSRLVSGQDLILLGDNAPAARAAARRRRSISSTWTRRSTPGARRRGDTFSVTAGRATPDRVGFGGRRYRSTLLQTLSYDDAFADYLGFLEPRLRRAP